MKNIPFLLILLTIACCSDPAAPDSEAGTVSLTFRASTEQETQLHLINATDGPIYYLGFSHSSPLKIVEIKTDTGWCITAWDWCATGAELQEVSSGSSVTIIVPPVRRNVPARVTFGIAEDPEGEYRILSSNEFIVP